MVQKENELFTNVIRGIKMMIYDIPWCDIDSLNYERFHYRIGIQIVGRLLK